MAVLLGVQREDGEWENFILTRVPNIQFLSGCSDVIGRKVPCFRYVEAYDGVPREDAIRIAKQLQGMVRGKRRDAFLDQAKNLRLMARGGTMK